MTVGKDVSPLFPGAVRAGRRADGGRAGGWVEMARDGRGRMRAAPTAVVAAGAWQRPPAASRCNHCRPRRPADVINQMQTDDMELKKLVYLYLINYAKTQPDLAIMAVNTFVKARARAAAADCWLCRPLRNLFLTSPHAPLPSLTLPLAFSSPLPAFPPPPQDSQDPNPLIRALAVRTMGCIRVDKITEYLCDPLHRCLKVRRLVLPPPPPCPPAGPPPLSCPPASMPCSVLQCLCRRCRRQSTPRTPHPAPLTPHPTAPAAGRGPVRAQDGGGVRGQAVRHQRRAGGGPRLPRHAQGLAGGCQPHGRRQRGRRPG